MPTHLPTHLPPRFHRARVLCTLDVHVVDVLLDMTLGVHLRKRIRVEGVDAKLVPAHLRREATHCLVWLVGGRDILVQLNDSTTEHFEPINLTSPPPAAAQGHFRSEATDATLPTIIGRVFVPCLGTVANEFVVRPFGDEHPLLEVGGFFRSLASRGFDVREARRVMKPQGVV